ncbi:MAG: Smr/MutS family protein [Gemmobacter sp.]|nr:Smr/MutS family protein [Gemmobacter sp.]
MARRRTLRPEEQEIWELVARTTRPLHPARPKAGPDAPALPVTVHHHPHPTPKPAKRPAGLPEFRVGQRIVHPPGGHDLAPSLSVKLAESPLRMDRNQYTKMARGKTAPEARLDLHGMTLAEAHPELIRFVLNAHSAGMRLVLVITGKGKLKDEGGPIPTRTGALRHQVPRWLALVPLGPVVLQIAEAHLKHGGSGAYYVYLRRHR